MKWSKSQIFSAVSQFVTVAALLSIILSQNIESCKKKVEPEAKAAESTCVRFPEDNYSCVIRLRPKLVTSSVALNQMVNAGTWSEIGSIEVVSGAGAFEVGGGKIYASPRYKKMVPIHLATGDSEIPVTYVLEVVYNSVSRDYLLGAYISSIRVNYTIDDAAGINIAAIPPEFKIDFKIDSLSSASDHPPIDSKGTLRLIWSAPGHQTIEDEFVIQGTKGVTSSNISHF